MKTHDIVNNAVLKTMIFVYLIFDSDVRIPSKWWTL